MLALTTDLSICVCACSVQVLITKLRSTNSAETQQYKKATKALLVLLPLLGVTYILVLVAPSTTHVIYYIQAVLVSIQVPAARAAANRRHGYCLSV